MIKATIFIALSLVWAFISRASLRKPRSHGFFRFFALELIAAVVFLNMRFWFRDPFSWNQIVSWILLVGSFLPGVPGIRLLATRGGPKTRVPDETPLIGFEKTTKLVTSGVFRYIRHPMYASLILLTTGALMKHPSLWAAGFAAIAVSLLYLTAEVEEEENIRYFGDEYSVYKKRTKRFIPYLF